MESKYCLLLMLTYNFITEFFMLKKYISLTYIFTPRHQPVKMGGLHELNHLMVHFEGVLHHHDSPFFSGLDC